MTTPIELMDGTRIELLPIGTRIRSKDHPELTGEIKHVEAYKVHKKDGKVDVLAYHIEWDDNDRAFVLLGWHYIYTTHESVEAVEDKTLGPHSYCFACGVVNHTDENKHHEKDCPSLNPPMPPVCGGEYIPEDDEI